MKTKSVRINDNHWGYAFLVGGIAPTLINGYKFKDRVSIMLYETEDTTGNEDRLHRGGGDGVL